MKQMRALAGLLYVLSCSGCGGALGGAVIGAGVGLAAVAIMPKEAVQATPSSLDFEGVPRGTHKDLQVAVRARKAGAVTVDRISVSGDTFSLVGAVNPPHAIAPGGELQVTVRFAPPSPGKRTGKLEISSFSGEDKPRVLELPLRGAGTE